MIKKKHFFNKTIVRAYDIRGIYNQTLFDNDAKAIGNIFGLKVGSGKTVNIGYDGRSSSKALKNSLISGLIEVGVNINEIGLVPTPLLYFSCYKSNAIGGIMVTGSHNPKDHNGFKFVYKNGPFYGEDLIEMSNTAQHYTFKEGKGNLEFKNYDDQYLERIFKSVKLKNKFRIAWDSGNGSAGKIMSFIANKINNENYLLFESIDGNFPNHHPDPSDPKNLVDIVKTVKEKKLDLGIAFDGDGDRIGVIDDKGRVIPGDQLLLLFAKDILKKKNRAKIIGDVKCSQTLFDEIEKLEGEGIISQTGHSHVKTNIKKFKADLAGEMSGHIFFDLDYYGFDDALYAAVKLVEILDENPKKLSEIIDDFPKTFNTPEIRIYCSDLKKFSLIEEISKKQKKINENVIDIDGVRVPSGNGWWLLRASNTQSEVVLRCEADSKENLKKQLMSVKNEISKIDSSISDKILVEKFI